MPSSFAKFLTAGYPRILATAGFILATVATVFTQKLPIKLYSSADGLASSAVTHVARDSQGFLWFSNRDGLARFDGTEFVNYRLPETASSQTFRYFLETRDGWIWFATDDGVYRTKRTDVTDVKPREEARGRNRVLDARKVYDGFAYVLFEDSRGTLWLGGSRLFRIDDRNSDQITVTEVPTPHTNLTNIFWITEGGDGSLWLAQLDGPLRILPDGRQIFYPIDRAAPGDEVYAIEIDDSGRVWFGQAGGLFVLWPESIDELQNVPDRTRREKKPVKVELGESGTVDLPTNAGSLLQMKFDRATAIFKERERVVVAMGTSLFLFDGNAYRRLGGRDILTGTTRSIVSDEQHDLWIGSTGGAIRFIQDGFATYDADAGFVDPQVSSIFDSPDGELLIAHGLWRISRFTADGIESAVLNVPSDVRFTWTSSSMASGPNGDIYALAREGLFRFPATSDLKELARQTPQEFPDQKGRPFYRAYTDRDKNIWFSLRGYTEQNGLLRFDPQTGSFEDMAALPGFPRPKPAASFAEDRAGNLWIGFYGAGGLVKYANGEFREYDLGVENGRGTLALHVDTKGRLWVGTTSHGIVRIEDPTREPFEIDRIGETQGLSSNNVRAMTSDEAGNVYVGTVQGVDRVSIETDAIRHFSTDDGLAADFITSAFRDRRGVLWFGTPNGLSKLVPPREEMPGPPNVFINELQVAGESYSISEFGQAAVGKLDLSSTQSNLQITAVGVGSRLQYQYKLEGSGSDEWSVATATRSFNFANLAPGSYTFRVRAVSPSGVPSERPATVSFVISPPFYRSWWFIALVVLVAAAGVIALDRYRVAKTRQIQVAYDDLRKSEEERRFAEAALERSRAERLAELERVRTRIATDLHDDIGSSLTQIAVLSQAAHRQAEHRDATVSAPLQRISDVSIELVNAMSDIVWAINPRRDNLRDLVQRMRRFASDVFTSTHIKFEFHAPPSENKLAIGANIRREVFAVFKEAVNNVARHSKATTARVDLSVDGDHLRMKVEDDGVGFDPEALLHVSMAPDSGGGNGLVNIRRRTSELGGHCEIISSQGAGTIVSLDIPLIGLLHEEIIGDAPASQAAGDSNGKMD